MRPIEAGRLIVQCPYALDRRYPNAPQDCGGNEPFLRDTDGVKWQDHGTRSPSLDESLMQKAVRDAVVKAGLTMRAPCHAFRNSYVPHLLESGSEI